MDLSKVLGKELLEGRFWTHSKTLVEGCLKVSPGCQNCWSEAMAMRFNGGKPFDGTTGAAPGMSRPRATGAGLDPVAPPPRNGAGRMGRR